MNCSGLDAPAFQPPAYAAYLGFRPQAGGTAGNALTFDNDLKVYIWPGTTLDGSSAAIQFSAVELKGSLQGGCTNAADKTTCKTFTVTGDWNIGQGATFTPSGSPVHFNSAVAQTIRARQQAFADVVFKGGGTYTAQAGEAMYFAGDFTINAGTTFVPPTDQPIYFTAGAGVTQKITAAGQRFKQAVFNGGGIYEAVDAFIADGNFNLDSGTFKGTVGQTLTFGGDFNIATGQTFQHNGAPVKFTGTGTHTIAPDDETFDTVQFTGGGVYRFSGASDFIVKGDFDLSSGTFVADDDKPLIIRPDATDTNPKFTIAAGSTFTKSTSGAPLRLEGDLVLADYNTTKQNLGKLVIGGSPDNVTLGSDIAAEALTVNSGNTYTTAGYDLTVTGSDGVSVSGNFDASDGGGGASTIKVTGKFEVQSGATFTKGSSTVDVTDTGTVNVTTSSQALNSFKVSGGGTAKLVDNLDADDDITVSSGTFDTNGKNVTVGGDFTVSGGTFTPTSGTVTFDGSAAQDLVDTGSSFVNLTINKSGTGTADDVNVKTQNLNVTQTLTLTDGELVQGADVEITAKTVSVASAGAWTHTGGSDTDNATITVGSGGVTNSGIVTFNAKGGAAKGGDADVIKIRSATAGTQVQWKGTGTYTWYDVDVKDSIRMSPAIECYSCTDSGNNTNINFHAVTQNLHITTSEPTTLSAGTSIKVSIQPYDNAGTVIGSGYTGEKTITFSGVSAAPNGTKSTALDNTNTAVNFGTGTKLTFQCDATNGCFANTTLVIYTAGSLSVDVSDGTYDSTGGTSYDLDLTVSPLTATAVKFTTQPSPTKVSSKVNFTTQPVVSIVDTYENVVTSDSTSKVTLKAVDPTDGKTELSGTLAATANPVTVSSGAATFAGVNYDKNEKMKLKATSGTLTSVLSQEITVVKSDSVTKLTDVNGTERLTYNIGEYIYVQVTDADENSDTSSKQTVKVTVRNATTGDTEEVKLEETGNDTGIFMNKGTAQPNAPLPSSNGILGRPDNFILEASSSGDTISVEYTDDDDSSDKTSDTAKFGQISFRVTPDVTGSVKAGDSFDVVISAVQGGGGLGNVLTTYSGTAVLSVNYVKPTTGTKQLTVVSAGTFAAGVATAKLRYDDAGTIQVVVADSVDPVMAGSSTDIVITAAKFSVSLPADTQTVGKEFEMTITAQNTSGETTPTYAGNVTVSVKADDKATLGTLSATSTNTFTAGVAKLKNTYDSWGKVHFTVTDDIYTNVTGDSAVVSFIPKTLDVSLSVPPGSRAGEDKYTYYVGESFTVTLEARGYDDKAITNYGGLVKLSTTAGLAIPTEHQFKEDEKGSYSFDVTTTTAEKLFTIDAADEAASLIGKSSPEAEVISVQVVVVSTYGSTGQPVSVTVKVVDSSGNVVRADSTTLVRIILNIEGTAVGQWDEAALLAQMTVPEESVIQLQNGEATFEVSSQKIVSITALAEVVPDGAAAPAIESIPGTINIGSIGRRSVRILTWSEVRTPVPTSEQS